MKNNLVYFVGWFLFGVFWVGFCFCFFFKGILVVAFSLLRARCDRVIRDGERSCGNEFLLKGALLIKVQEHLGQLWRY